MDDKPGAPDDCPRRLEECRRHNRQLAHVLSHDLREPLRMVTSYMDLLNKRYRGRVDKTADEFIRYAVEGAWRAEAMLDGLLEFSRVDTRVATPERIDTAAAVAAAVERLRAEYEDVPFDIDMPPGLPVVQADAEQVRQLWNHVLRNAVIFRESSRPLRIAVKAGQRGRYACFTVTDNGIGFDQKQAERIFELLQRLHPVGRYPGVGAGLAVARRIVERHGGTMGAESRRGEGTAFWFTLPVVD